jgi:arabinofuranosyltransferase
MVWVRADGFVMASLFVGFLLVGGRLREALVGGSAAVAATALQFAGRAFYYESLLPNTYYVKVTGSLSDRLVYAWDLFSGFIALLPFIALLVLTLVFVRRPDPKLARCVRFGGYFTLSWLAYWFYVGGDISEMRFLLVLLPLGFAAFVERLPPELPPQFVARASLAAAVLVLGALPFLRLDLQSQVTRYDAWTTLGEFLGERYPDSLVAVDGAGKIPYFSRLQTIDMLGLCDAHIAHLERDFDDPGHSKYDAEYVYSRKPDIIASRVRDSRMNLFTGVRVKQYQRAGYEVAYLLHLGPTPTGPPLVEYRKIPEQERLAYLMEGYGYAVLLEHSLLERAEPLSHEIP